MKIDNLVATGSLTISGSLGVEGQPTGTVTSASYAITASYASNAGGGGGGGAFPYSGDGQLTGSLGVTGSLEFSYLNSGGNWSAGGAVINPRNALAGAGVQNASLVFGSSQPSITTCTEEYNGSSWSTGGGLANCRYGAVGGGTQNAAIAALGQNPTALRCTEEYDGSSWSAGGAFPSINVPVSLAGAGTQDNLITFGGSVAPSPIATVNSYNGTSWSAETSMTTPRYGLIGLGTGDSALATAGRTPTYVTCTEIYNGTSWSAGGNITTARNEGSGAGITNAGLIFGGSNPSIANICSTEEYNGTSWAAGGDLTTARRAGAGTGTQSSALYAAGEVGGVPNSYVSCTEEYSNSTTLNPYFKTCYDAPTSGSYVILPKVSSSHDYVDDTAAASGGIPIGGIYRSGSIIRLRQS